MLVARVWMAGFAGQRLVHTFQPERIVFVPVGLDVLDPRANERDRRQQGALVAVVIGMAGPAGSRSGGRQRSVNAAMRAQLVADRLVACDATAGGHRTALVTARAVGTTVEPARHRVDRMQRSRTGLHP
ncbi:MAG: hypothetical protein ACE37K_19340 [Planctomycetota bacterium]